LATYVLIHGAGDVAANWDAVSAELRSRGHDVVAVDLPAEDESAGLAEYTDTVVAAVGERDGLVVVGHSLGGFTAPLVCHRLPVDLLVLVAAMIPAPGETGDEWWSNSGLTDARRDLNGDWDDDDEIAVYLQDAPPDVAAAAIARGRDQAGAPLREPWPLDEWPDVPTRYLLCRDDRFLPAEWTRRHVRERLGITPDEIEGGHMPFVSRPKQLAERLETLRACG
jgi:pimeloyl-ACP methyl ester carboxylesterase